MRTKTKALLPKLHDDSPFFSREKAPAAVPLKTPVFVPCADGIVRKVTIAFEYENGDYMFLAQAVCRNEGARV